MKSERILARFLLIFGLANIFVHPVLPWFLPRLFFWTPRNVPYEFMIGGIYLALGVVMIQASREPLKHKLLVDFIILGNFFHAAVMVFFGILLQPSHLYGDVIWISAQWLIPILYYPWGLKNFLRPNLADS